MVISDPTIDPVTGLPLLNPSDVVQQIPLGVQAFPWQDMGATSLPTRGPLYGDDILPVSAFVTGQHPQTGSAQTVQTDGKHNAMTREAVYQNLGQPIPAGTTAPVDVNVVTGGGGGGGKVFVQPVLGQAWKDSTGTETDQYGSFSIDTYKTFHGYQIALYFMSSNAPFSESSYFTFALRGLTIHNLWEFAQLPVFSPPTPYPQPMLYTQSVYSDVGVDLSAHWPAGVTVAQQLSFKPVDGQWTATFAVYMSA